MTSAAPLRVAVFTIPAVGHANPMLAIVEALVRSGADVRGFGAQQLAAPFRQAGASYAAETVDTRPEFDFPTNHLAYRSFIRPLAVAAPLLRQVEEYSPDVAVFDPFCIHGLLAHRLLRIPAAVLATFPGYGSLGESFALQYSGSHPVLEHVNERYRASFGLDILGDGFLPVLFAQGELSIVTSIPELCESTSLDTAPNLHRILQGRMAAEAYVGPCIGNVTLRPDTPDRTPVNGAADMRHDRTAAFPFELLDEARRLGRRIVLFSLGTVITDFRFDTPVGGAPSGRQFLVAAVEWLIEAVGDDPGITVVAALGPRLTHDDEPEWPERFIVRDFVPQAEILNRYADAFITHHGANSTAESIMAGVPMISMPGAGDQLTGARKAVEAGLALASWDLANVHATCNAALLRASCMAVLGSRNHRLRCRRMAERMSAAGGGTAAAREIAGLADRRRHKALAASGPR